MPSTNRCRKCKSTVQTGLKCTICGVVSHKSCLNALKGVKFIDDATVICCPESPVNASSSGPLDKQDQPTPNSETTVNFASSVEEMKIKYLEELLRQKDLTISNQAIAINALQEQLFYLKRELQSQKATSTDANIVAPTHGATEVDTYAFKTKQGVPNNKNKGKNKNINNTPMFSSATVSHSLHVAQAQRVCQDIINLNNDAHGTSSQPTPQEIVQERTAFAPRRRSRNILVGDAKHLPDSIVLKSALIKDYKHFHSTNWDPDTEEGSRTDYLRGIIPEVEVEKLNSRNPSRYASFKVSVPSTEAHKLTRSEIWPSGVLLNQFFRPRLPRSTSNKTE